MPTKFKNALVSCSDKTGLIELLGPLQKLGLRIVSTGGTAEFLKKNGLEVVDVSEQTHFPEVMDGRVKTLHPHIHMALLARADVPEDMKLLKAKELEPFDLVVVNLYPFEQAVEKGVKGAELIEYIDVGGPSMLRAAAKSHSRITVVCDPADYQKVLDGEYDSLSGRQRLAAKVFAHTGTYDVMIAEKLGAQTDEPFVGVAGAKVQTLRYGENPHQPAVWLKRRGALGGLHAAQILQGKELSYNNLLDLDAATRTLQDCSGSFACVAVKHNSPCGVAVGATLESAVQKALEADPVSVFGGVVAISASVTGAVAKELSKLFLECVIAPDFSVEALSILGAKKNLRLLAWPEMMTPVPENQLRSVAGGLLVQPFDRIHNAALAADWTCWGQQPTEKITQDLLLAWSVCGHLKSNAIAVVSGGQTVGLGMGQVNRVDAVEQAISRYKKFHGQTAGAPVLASDGFFPFPDSIELAADAKIHWVIQPGGSVKDEEVRKVAERRGVSIVLTHQRHFLH